MKRAFTLIEVLIAGSVLFVVTAAVVGLSNSIIQGTSVNADSTVTNAWASEGLELVTKARDDSLLSGNQEQSQPVWFSPTFDPGRYGWYKLVQVGQTWQLQQQTGLNNVLDFSLVNAQNAESLTSQGLNAYRLICVEAVGAVSQDSNGSANCNADRSGNVIRTDGDRSKLDDCDSVDTYCLNTKASLNRDQLSTAASKLIPAGNAVKIRSVVIWQDKTNFRVSDIASLLTNWKGSEQF